MRWSSERKHAGLPSLLLLGIVGSGPGCLVTEPNPNYCSNINGNVFCSQRHDGERPFCTIGSDVCLASVPPEERNAPSFDGCVQELPTPECYSPCGGGQVQADADACFGVSDGTETGGEESSSSSSDGGSTTSEVSADGTSSTTDDGTSTGSEPVCGNGVLEEGEDCDGTDLAEESCESRGFEDGTLSCGMGCTFDESGCVTCGNEIRESTELCDGSDLDGQSCTTLGFDGGTLSCDGCTAFDLSGCTICGNGARERGEICDGTDLAGETCASLMGSDFDGGMLACDTDCMGFDTAGCSLCGDGIREGGEVCDGVDLDAQTCVTQGFDGGALACGASCMAFDVAGCAICGNGEQEGAESCDGADLNGHTCASEGFAGGVLACGLDCLGFVTAGCTSSMCDNGILEPGEICDGMDFGGLSCEALGFGGGSLSCVDCVSIGLLGCVFLG